MLSIATLLATFVAGLGSFLAPCTVPLLPAYLACVSGVSAAELTNPDRHSFRLRLLAGSLLYVAGFTVVFVVLGLTAGGIARVANGAVSGRIVEIVGGVAVILFGLAIIGVVRIGMLERTRGFQLPERLRRRGVFGAFLVGVVFGIGWTPCVGPYLAAALTLAALSSHALTGALLLIVYSIGLGVPFIAVALLWASLPELPRRLNRLVRPLTLAGGVITVALGVPASDGCLHAPHFLPSAALDAKFNLAARRCVRETLSVARREGDGRRGPSRSRGYPPRRERGAGRQRRSDPVPL